ncbi:glycoside hydrolase family 95 protein [Paenibacillus glycanilyticus]|uniref:Alpha/beta hydrolase n=1 Tax=Paenibacillus glycanilyticus TaxID=126569 RepID=A0ABQ6GDW4_9BACL|nr:glycoside hydrolase family 95 protein [Paenibacillus glycanilyticus]GLX68450.1 alpha/beta hydrolase [Paenibacillus glycanilyticus]
MSIQQSKPTKLWYQEPVNEWVEALPLGNGRIGAMIYSQSDQDIIMLNEDTLWSGYPKDTNVPGASKYYYKAMELVNQKKYKEGQELIEDQMLGPFTQSYMPLGNLKLTFNNINKSLVSDYYRDLNLDSAISTTSFVHQGVCYTREAFISAVDQSMVIKLSADQPQSISFHMTMDSQLQYSVLAQDNKVILDGLCPSHVDPNYVDSLNPIIYEADDRKKGIAFRTIASVDPIGGIVTTTENGIEVAMANSVVIKVCIRTSFNGFNKLPYLEGQDYQLNCEIDWQHVRLQSYDELKQKHVVDYQSLYNRVDIHLGEDIYYDIPTNERLKRFGETQDDKGLYTLIFQYGRYLLIASSREGTTPANLQGIWNKELRAPWSSNYTVNINTQMNYWPAEITNLSELHRPLFDLIEVLKETGSVTAQTHYDAGGFTSHHNVDIWGHSSPVGNKSRNTAGYAFWPMSAGWLCQHLYEHYEYSLDNTFLQETAYPIMKKAAQFYIDLLVQDEDGYLMLSPSTSPENAFIYEGQKSNVAKTCTMTMAIVKEIFINCIQSSKLLSMDVAFANLLQEKVDRLYPYQIGSKGQLLEWNEEFEEAEPDHRHISHLYPLHPGHEISVTDTPELAAACRTSLNLRGDDGTGWSLGWKINAWARLHDGNRALKLLKRQLQYVHTDETNYLDGGGTYPNLFDAHPPFQIDGNFGACAGIAEMFLQSNNHKVWLLPALPDEFENGYVKGLRAKDGLLVDIHFNEGKLTKALFTATADQLIKCTIIYKNSSTSVQLNKGEIFTLEGQFV